MIKQSTDLLYTFDELLNLLNTTDKIVLGIDEKILKFIFHTNKGYR